jgi:PAS domain S-box-containing protein
MPFRNASPSPLLVRARAWRHRPVVGIALALLSVATAVGLRAMLDGWLITGVPFIGFYPAIIVAGLLGGVRAGALAIVLSCLSEWYLFMPDADVSRMDRQQAWSLAAFCLGAGLNLAIVALFNRAIDQLWLQERNVRTVVEAVPSGVLAIDGRGRITLANRAVEHLFGYPAEDLLGQPVEILIPERFRTGHRQLLQTFLRQPDSTMASDGREIYGLRRDGREFPIEVGLNGVDYGPRAVLATITDISARKRNQEQQRLLIGELHHRTQNIFTVIQAIARRSLFSTRSVEAGRHAFLGRLHALSSSYTVLTESAWTGAPLAEILRREFEGFPGRILVTGPELVISPSAVQVMTMVAHELMTNATKYGALSSAVGHVEVRWGIRPDDATFHFEWKEQGGPPVEMPTERGYGRTVLESAARYVGAQVRIAFDPDGFRYELEAPLTSICTGTQPAQPPVQSRILV